MDFMTNQGEIGWNMSALDLLLKHNKVSTAHFQISLFTNMIHFVDQSEGKNLYSIQISLKGNGHTLQSANQKLCPTCCICKIKENWQNASTKVLKVGKVAIQQHTTNREMKLLTTQTMMTMNPPTVILVLLQRIKKVCELF